MNYWFGYVAIGIVVLAAMLLKSNLAKQKKSVSSSRHPEVFGKSESKFSYEVSGSYPGAVAGRPARHLLLAKRIIFPGQVLRPRSRILVCRLVQETRYHVKSHQINRTG